MWSNDRENNFRFYYDSLKNGTYVACSPDDDSKKELDKITKKVKAGGGKKVKKDDLHCTLMYSRRGNPNIAVNKKANYSAKLNKFAMLDDCLVILLDSNDIIARNADLSNSGLVHTYNPYTPHITVVYGYEGELPDNKILRKGEEKIEIVLVDEYAEPLREEDNEVDSTRL